MADTTKTTLSPDSAKVKPTNPVPANPSPADETATPVASTAEELLSDPIVPDNQHNPKPPRVRDMPAQNVPGTVIAHGGSQEEIQSPVQLRTSPQSVYDEQTSDIDMGGNAINRRLADTSPTTRDAVNPRDRKQYPLVEPVKVDMPGSDLPKAGSLEAAQLVNKQEAEDLARTKENLTGTDIVPSIGQVKDGITPEDPEATKASTDKKVK